ncbi:MAG TPA: hypothetical protein ENH23_05325 [candidate division Zixibacteria bacterium]|nr:hypothetical protein [candidate division Zixibacteria bacterium]
MEKAQAKKWLTIGKGRQTARRFFKVKMKGLERMWKNGDLKFKTILKDFQFVREGSASTYLNTLSSEDVKYINNKAGDLMKMFGYL